MGIFIDRRWARAMVWGAILLPAAILLLAHSPPATAADGWVQNPANGHLYRTTEWMSWPDAEAQAEAWGGHLVTINNAEEEAWLQAQFFDPPFRPGFWIGLNDIAVEGAMVWSSGETPGYQNWCPGEPNDLDGEDAVNLEGYPFDNPIYYCWNDNPASNWRQGIVEKPGMLIDVKPGSYPNSINLGAKGVLPVAVLTDATFDATTFDPVTARFAGAAPVRWAAEDVDYDGDLDLIFHFKTQELNLDMDSTEATLSGMTFSAVYLEGSDTVNIVP